VRFPQTFIDDLRRQADIVRIVQDYVTLKKTGANWVAPCPFHKETKPSFSVSPAKEMFFCFGCHKGGSVFTFVMEIERVTFPEAIKIVAEKSGVPLPKMVDDSRFEARQRESDQLIELNQWALQWWRDQLESKSQPARGVREYLQDRGITEETIKTFRLGFAPDSWEALSTHLRQKGATQEQLEKSGLVVKKDEGGSYDRFRGRLIFPVFDAQGKPIAFGGRTLEPEGEPKYLNSPETPAYTKGRHLYGLNLTRDEIRRNASNGIGAVKSDPSATPISDKTCEAPNTGYPCVFGRHCGACGADLVDQHFAARPEPGPDAGPRARSTVQIFGKDGPRSIPASARRFA